MDTRAIAEELERWEKEMTAAIHRIGESGPINRTRMVERRNLLREAVRALRAPAPSPEEG